MTPIRSIRTYNTLARRYNPFRDIYGRTVKGLREISDELGMDSLDRCLRFGAFIEDPNLEDAIENELIWLVYPE